MLYNLERPKNFDEIVGQELVVENIRNQSIRNQFFPVFILCGQYGSGKTTMAGIIAKAANCTQKDERGNPCGTCPSCMAIEQGSSDDLIEIDGASNNGVENVRKLLGQASLMSTGKKKVIIIDEAHMLTKSAFNALLITLENPPEHCIFILCTTEKDALPETVISRAPVYTFGKIPDALVSKHVREVAQKNGIKISEDASGLLARYVNGAMRNALQLLEHLSLQKNEGEEISEDDVIRILGLSSMEQRSAFLQGCLCMDVPKIVSTLRACEKNGISIKTFVQDVLKMNTDLLLVQSGAEVVGTEYYLGELKKLLLYGNHAIARLSVILSKISSEYAARLNTERIVVDVISGMQETINLQAAPIVSPEVRIIERNSVSDRQTSSEVEIKKPDLQKDMGSQAQETTLMEAEQSSPAISDKKDQEQMSESKHPGFQKLSESEDNPFAQDAATENTTENTTENVVIEESNENAVSEEPQLNMMWGFSEFFPNMDIVSSGEGKSNTHDLIGSLGLSCGGGSISVNPQEEDEEDDLDHVESGYTVQEVEEMTEFEAPKTDVLPEKSELETPDDIMKEPEMKNNGYLSWDQMADLGLVKKEDEIGNCEEEDSKDEDLLSPKAKFQECSREIIQEDDEKMDVEPVRKTENSYIRESKKKMENANLQLSELLKHKGFDTIYESASRIESKDGKIYLYFKGSFMERAAKYYLRGYDHVIAERDK